MSKETTIDIIKNALMIEYRGKALYESAVKNATNEDAKAMFQMMADEEKSHVEILSKQLKLVSEGKKIDASGLENIENPEVDEVLTKKVIKQISGAGYEAAVIDSALELEKRAVEYYSEREEAATSDDEKKLFNWLVKWEKEHMIMLAHISDEIKEQVWYDNNFWPLD
jgi:rubrerythrin